LKRARTAGSKRKTPTKAFPTYFFDTSALVKRYHREEGTDQVNTLFAKKPRWILISDLAVIEFHSALVKKVRTKEITAETFRQVCDFFLNECQQGLYEVVAMNDEIKTKSVELLNRYALSYDLRTLDALQLATVVRAAEARRLTAFVSSDPRFLKLIREKVSTFKALSPTDLSDSSS
jgi:predicted nucleic acid-binding protein